MQVFVSNPEKTIAPDSIRAAAIDPIDPLVAAAARVVMERCDVLGGISDEEGRITRTFLSPATRRAHTVVTQWMQEAGMAVRIDAAGNVIGRREAGVKKSPTVAIGSHLDTVPNAGKYDGILGVLAGIALVELVKDAVPPFAIEVVAFSEEEGVRFGRPYIGSHAYTGTLDAAWLELRDKDGLQVEQAIRKFGIDPSPLRSTKARADLAAYLELHIEQGPVLEKDNHPIAVVRGIAAQTRLAVELKGSAAHAGTTPMNLRRDALAGAAEIILNIEATATKQQIVATVGRINVLPNGSNVVPESAEFTIDLRSNSDERRDKAITAILTASETIARGRGLAFRVTNRVDFPAIEMSPQLLTELTTIAAKFGGDLPGLWSGAGHDAAIMAGVTHAAMIFLRNPGGISHNPLEEVAEKDVAVALTVGSAFLKRLIVMIDSHELEPK